MKSTNAKSTNKTNWILFLIAVGLIIAPLILNSKAGYGGADGEAKAIIAEINPTYKPWVSSLYKPPSGEIESLLFSTQAAIGAGFIGYYLGSRRRK